MSAADIIAPWLFAPSEPSEWSCNCLGTSSGGTPILVFSFCVPVPESPPFSRARNLDLPTAQATINPHPHTYTTISAVVAAARQICGGCISFSLAIGLIAVLSGRICWGCGGAGLVDLTRGCGSRLVIYGGGERCRSICSRCLSRVAWGSSDGKDRCLKAVAWGRAVEASELRTLRSCLETDAESALALYDVAPDFIACAERAIELNGVHQVQPVSGFPLVIPPASRMTQKFCNILMRRQRAPGIILPLWRCGQRGMDKRMATRSGVLLR